MNKIIKLGKKRTILISISILLVSIHSTYLYHAVRLEIDTLKLIQQIVRFLLTIGLLTMVYKGKKWAKIISVILFALGLLILLPTLFTIDRPFINKIPLIVMASVYSIAIYHFGFSKSYKAFFDFQNSNITESTSEV